MTQINAALAPAAGHSVRAVRSSPVLEGWRLTGLLGEGRWTRVYLAQPASCPEGRPCDYAMKVLEEHAHSPQCLEMLRREAYLGRSLVHPHLTAVLHSHLQRPPYFLVLPRLEGTTLSEALAVAGSLSVSHALWIARQTAEALKALHDHGWRHGDVKPANLHVAPTGHATLLDLGLAQPLENRAIAVDRVFAGSVAYAAPETFCAAQPVGAASDVYSLGVVLFETLTGRLPFRYDHPDETAAAHLRTAPPDMRSLVPQVPACVSRAVARMLAKDPLRRPTSGECVELLTALEIETFGESAVA